MSFVATAAATAETACYRGTHLLLTTLQVVDTLRHLRTFVMLEHIDCVTGFAVGAVTGFAVGAGTGGANAITGTGATGADVGAGCGGGVGVGNGVGAGGVLPQSPFTELPQSSHATVVIHEVTALTRE